MFAIAVLLLVCLGAAVLGTLVTGLFSLALVSVALLLGAGAVGLTLQRPLDADEDGADEDGAGEDSLPSEQEAAVTSLASRRRAQSGGEVSRAA